MDNNIMYERRFGMTFYFLGMSKEQKKFKNSF